VGSIPADGETVVAQWQSIGQSRAEYSRRKNIPVW